MTRFIVPDPITPLDTEKKHLGNLGSLGGSHLLAILVVTHTRGRGPVSAANTRSDTRDILLAGIVRDRGGEE